MTRRPVYWWTAAVLFAAAFFFLSLQREVYDFSVGLVAGPLHVLPRKLMATVCFGILSYCVGRAADRGEKPADWALPVLTGTLFSAFIEVAQHEQNRYLAEPFEPKVWNVIDVLTGTLGGLLAVWGLVLTRRVRQNAASSRAEAKTPGRS